MLTEKVGKKIATENELIIYENKIYSKGHPSTQERELSLLCIQRELMTYIQWKECTKSLLKVLWGNKEKKHQGSQKNHKEEEQLIGSLQLLKLYTICQYFSVYKNVDNNTSLQPLSRRLMVICLYCGWPAFSLAFAFW